MPKGLMGSSPSSPTTMEGSGTWVPPGLENRWGPKGLGFDSSALRHLGSEVGRSRHPPAKRCAPQGVRFNYGAPRHAPFVQRLGHRLGKTATAVQLCDGAPYTVDFVRRRV